MGRFWTRVDQLRALLGEAVRATAESVLAAADDRLPGGERSPSPPALLEIIERPARWTTTARMQPWGACVHTTGRGIYARAERDRTTLAEAAMRVWDAGGEGPHYVIDLDGTCYRYTPDVWVGRHAKVLPEHRAAMLSGAWEREVPAAGVELWRTRWPGYRSPQHLYPTKTPNACFIGIEMVPLQDITYTDAQYDVLIRLLRELAAHHRWPEGWNRTPRLLGHEDVEPYRRWDPVARGGQGWDPGALRASPRFDWPRVITALDAA